MGFATTKLNSILLALSGVSCQASNKFLGAVESNISFGEMFLRVIWFSIVDLLLAIWDTVMKVLITVGQWILNILDFLFVFIREFIGLNADYSSLDDIAHSDMIFEFLFDNAIVDVIKGMIGMALVLIILFSIIAIIKSEYTFLVSGQGNSKKAILSRALKSIFLIVLVPIIAIGGIILSNSILQSLYNATAGGTDVSLGTQIFVSSGYSANAYRQYAETDYKIPITYRFEELTDADNVYGYGTDGTISEIDEAYKSFMSSSSWNKGLTTYLMFQSKLYSSMDKIDRLQQYATEAGTESSYNQVYDKGIITKKVEYYVMADVMDYAVRNNARIYFKTAEDVYKSWVAAGNAVVANGDETIPIRYNATDKTYDFDIFYNYTNEKLATEYHHKEGATDEADGAKFIVAIQKQGVDEGGDIVNYYYPLTSLDSFACDYIKGATNIVLARGLFYEGTYPTAIKDVDGVTEFYRDDLNVPVLADFFPVISYEQPPEGTTEEIGVKLIKMGVTMLTGIDASQLIPYVYFNFDVMHLFTKQTYSVVKLTEGFKNDYNFSQEGIVVNNVYDVSTFNVIILYFAAILLFGILLRYMFGLAIRVMDIVLLAISYPAIVSTIPLDGGSRFSGWTKQFLDKLLATYGIVVGINIVLMLCPIVFSLDLFTPEMLIQSNMISLNTTAVLGAHLLNAIVELMFMLVAFASLKSFGAIIEHIITGNDPSDIYKEEKGQAGGNGLYATGDKVVRDLKALPSRVGNIVSGKFVVDGLLGAAGKDGKRSGGLVSTVTSFLPGSALISAQVRKAKSKAEEVAGDAGKDEIEGLKQEISNLSMSDVVDVAKNVGSATSGGGFGADAQDQAYWDKYIGESKPAFSSSENPKPEKEKKDKDATKKDKNLEKGQITTSFAEKDKKFENSKTGTGIDPEQSAREIYEGMHGEGSWENASQEDKDKYLKHEQARYAAPGDNSEYNRRLQEYKDAHHGKEYVPPEKRDDYRAVEIEKWNNMSLKDKIKYVAKNAFNDVADKAAYKKDQAIRKFGAGLTKVKKTAINEANTIKKGIKKTGKQAKEVGKTWSKFGKGFTKDAKKTAKSFASIFKPVAKGKAGLILMPLTSTLKAARFAITTSWRLAKNTFKLARATAKTAYFAGNTAFRFARYSYRTGKRVVKATARGAKKVVNKFKSGVKYVTNSSYRFAVKYRKRQAFINYKHAKARYKPIANRIKANKKQNRKNRWSRRINKITNSKLVRLITREMNAKKVSGASQSNSNSGDGEAVAEPTSNGSDEAKPVPPPVENSPVVGEDKPDNSDSDDVGGDSSLDNSNSDDSDLDDSDDSNDSDKPDSDDSDGGDSDE